MPPRRPLAERFWEKVDKNGPIVSSMTTRCWVWVACVDGCGYGMIGLGNGKVGKANRVSWELHFGPLVGKECALHHCDNPGCVRPDHLFKGTQKDNAVDREKKGRLLHPAGAGHWSRTHPEKLKNMARGDRAGLRVHPERAPSGERNSHAKLTDDLVLALREEAASTDISQQALGVKYGLSKGAAGKIVRRQTWRHI